MAAGVKSDLFKEVKFCIIEDGDDMSKIKALLLEGGGHHQSYLSDMVTHVISDNPESSGVSEAQELFEKPVVTSRWVILSAKCGHLLPLNGFSPLRNQIFSGTTICHSQISKKDKKHIWAIVSFHGGLIRWSLGKTCTHLVVGKPDGAKYQKALQYPEMKIVTPDWVIDSLKCGKLCDENMYHPKLLILPEPEVPVVPVIKTEVSLPLTSAMISLTNMNLVGSSTQAPSQIQSVSLNVQNPISTMQQPVISIPDAVIKSEPGTVAQSCTDQPTIVSKMHSIPLTAQQLQLFARRIPIQGNDQRLQQTQQQMLQLGDQRLTQALQQLQAQQQQQQQQQEQQSQGQAQPKVHWQQQRLTPAQQQHLQQQVLHMQRLRILQQQQLRNRQPLTQAQLAQLQQQQQLHLQQLQSPQQKQILIQQLSQQQQQQLQAQTQLQSNQGEGSQQQQAISAHLQQQQVLQKQQQLQLQLLKQKRLQQLQQLQQQQQQALGQSQTPASQLQLQQTILQHQRASQQAQNIRAQQAHLLQAQMMQSGLQQQLPEQSSSQGDQGQQSSQSLSQSTMQQSVRPASHLALLQQSPTQQARVQMQLQQVRLQAARQIRLQQSSLEQIVLQQQPTDVNKAVRQVQTEGSQLQLNVGPPLQIQQALAQKSQGQPFFPQQALLSESSQQASQVQASQQQIRLQQLMLEQRIPHSASDQVNILQSPSGAITVKQHSGANQVGLQQLDQIQLHAVTGDQGQLQQIIRDQEQPNSVDLQRRNVSSEQAQSQQPTLDHVLSQQGSNQSQAMALDQSQSQQLLDSNNQQQNASQMTNPQSLPDPMQLQTSGSEQMTQLQQNNQVRLVPSQLDQVRQQQSPLDQAHQQQSPLNQTRLQQSPLDQIKQQSPLEQVKQQPSPLDQVQQPSPLDQLRQQQSPLDQVRQQQSPLSQIRQPSPLDQVRQQQSSLDQMRQQQSPLSQIRQLSPLDQVRQQQSPLDQVRQQQSPLDQIRQQQSPSSQIRQQQSPSSQIRQQQSPSSQMRQQQSPSSQIRQQQSPSQIRQQQSPLDQVRQQQSPMDQIRQQQSPLDQIRQQQSPLDQVRQQSPLGQVQPVSVEQIKQQTSPLDQVHQQSPLSQLRQQQQSPLNQLRQQQSPLNQLLRQASPSNQPRQQQSPLDQMRQQPSPLDQVRVQNLPLDQVRMQQIPIDQIRLQRLASDHSRIEQVLAQQSILEQVRQQSPLDQVKQQQQPSPLSQLQQSTLDDIKQEKSPLEQQQLQQSPLSQVRVQQSPLDQSRSIQTSLDQIKIQSPLDQVRMQSPSEQAQIQQSPIGQPRTPTLQQSPARVPHSPLDKIAVSSEQPNIQPFHVQAGVNQPNVQQTHVQTSLQQVQLHQATLRQMQIQKAQQALLQQGPLQHVQLQQAVIQAQLQQSGALKPAQRKTPPQQITFQQAQLSQGQLQQIPIGQIQIQQASPAGNQNLVAAQLQQNAIASQSSASQTAPQPQLQSPQQQSQAQAVQKNHLPQQMAAHLLTQQQSSNQAHPQVQRFPQQLQQTLRHLQKPFQNVAFTAAQPPMHGQPAVQGLQQQLLQQRQQQLVLQHVRQRQLQQQQQQQNLQQSPTKAQGEQVLTAQHSVMIKPPPQYPYDRQLTGQPRLQYPAQARSVTPQQQVQARLSWQQVPVQQSQVVRTSAAPQGQPPNWQAVVKEEPNQGTNWAQRPPSEQQHRDTATPAPQAPGTAQDPAWQQQSPQREVPQTLQPSQLFQWQQLKQLELRRQQLLQQQQQNASQQRAATQLAQQPEIPQNTPRPVTPGQQIQHTLAVPAQYQPQTITVTSPHANQAPNLVVQTAAQVTPKTKTALANLLNTRLQGTGRAIEEGSQVVVRAAQVVAQQAQPSAVARVAAEGTPVAAPTAVAHPLPPERSAIPQIPHVTFYGHDPRIQIPPDLILLGCIFVIQDYNKIVGGDKLDSWKKVIKQHGGEVENSYSFKCTHVVCESQRNSVVQQAMREGKRCVTAHWLNDILQHKKLKPPWLALHLPLPFSEEKPCKNQIITITNFEGEERKWLKYMIQALGAKYTGYMSVHNTLIICKRKDSLKALKAKEWKIPVVNVQWLHDVMFGHYDALRLPMAHKYQLFDMENHFKIDYALVPHLMAAWKAPIKITEEMWKKFRPLASVDGNKAADKKRKCEAGGESPQKKIRVKSPPFEENIPLTTQNPPSTEHKPHVMFTGLENTAAYKRIVCQLGGCIAVSAVESTHLVTRRLARTVKFLCAIHVVRYVVTPEWLKQCEKENRFVSERPYILRDLEAEKTFGFSLRKVLNRIDRSPVFQGIVFFLTPGLAIKPELLKGIIECGGGTAVLKRKPTMQQVAIMEEAGSKFIIISCENDLHLCKEFLQRGLCVQNAEFVLTGSIRQELDYKSFAFNTK